VIQARAGLRSSAPMLKSVSGWRGFQPGMFQGTQHGVQIMREFVVYLFDVNDKLIRRGFAVTRSRGEALSQARAMRDALANTGAASYRVAEI